MKKTLLLLILFPSLALAQTTVTRYVVGTCTSFNGDGTTTSCAASNGAAGAYNTLKNALDDLDADFADIRASGTNNNLVVQIENADYVDTSWDAILTGITTDSTHTVTIQASTAAKFSGQWDEAKPIMAGFNSSGIRISISNVVIDGLQVRAGSVDDINLNGIRIDDTAANVTVKNSMIRPSAACSTFCSGVTGINGMTDHAGNVYVINTVFEGFSRSGNAGYKVINHGSGKSYLYNVTMHNMTQCIDDGFTDVVAKNVLCSGTSFSGGGSLDASSTNNAGTMATVAGSSARTSQTFTFVDSANMNFQLTGADAGGRNYGADLSADGAYSFTTDALGVTRPEESVWDDGAFEYVATTTTTTTTTSSTTTTTLATCNRKGQKEYLCAKGQL